ncbi:hypothetical protein PC116_g31188, partial [Phytophthora cactorum]
VHVTESHALAYTDEYAAADEAS